MDHEANSNGEILRTNAAENDQTDMTCPRSHVAATPAATMKANMEAGLRKIAMTLFWPDTIRLRVKGATTQNRKPGMRRFWICSARVRRWVPESNVTRLRISPASNISALSMGGLTISSSAARRKERSD
jgi:hypothetical protein